MSAQTVDVLAVLGSLNLADPAQRPSLTLTRAAVAELIAERDRLQARLDYNRCGRGHETLPLVLWDCPECHNVTKRKLAELIEASERVLAATEVNAVYRERVAARTLLRVAIAHARAAR